MIDGPPMGATPIGRAVAAAEQLDVARRQRRHDAVTRNKLDGVERRPVAPDPGIVFAGAAVGIFEGEMRDMAAGTSPQIVDTRIMPVELRKVRTAAVSGDRFRLWRGS